ncbi:hypothetical protein [Streptomyces sirii]|uniref:hypothetical protein n=1 Tax=Streptomyces sirii TaxID=3127701 RepID=UPI003D36E713
MTWPATTRYRQDPAPGGLGLVQDLLNTVAAGAPRRPDFLAALEDAQAWADEAIAEWSAVTGQPVPPWCWTPTASTGSGPSGTTCTN